MTEKKMTAAEWKALNETEKKTVREYIKIISEEEMEKEKKAYKGLEEAFNGTTTGDKIEQVYIAMSNLIQEKNKRYGNSVMEPLGIFNSHVKNNNDEALNGILIRLDDKLKRIKNSEVLRKNDVSDLMGYLAFLCVNKEWTDFSDLID